MTTEQHNAVKAQVKERIRSLVGRHLSATTGRLQILLWAPATRAMRGLASDLRERLSLAGHAVFTSEEVFLPELPVVTQEAFQAEVADMVVVFAASPGSMVELGMLLSRATLAAKTVVFIPESARASFSAQAAMQIGSVVRFYREGDVQTGALVEEAIRVVEQVALVRMIDLPPSSGVSRSRTPVESLLPRDFEHLCLEILRHSGLTVVQGLSGPDCGIDIVAYGRLPFAPSATKVVAECKVHRKSISSDEVKAFIEKTRAFGADYGVLFVSSDVAPRVREAVKDAPVSILDRTDIERLAADQSFSQRGQA